MTDFEKACEVDNSNSLYTQDNVIEFLRNSKKATVTFCQPKFVTKIKKLAEQYPDEVKIVKENKDNSIVAHVPTSYVKISRPREYTEEQKAAMAKRLRRKKNVQESS